MTDNELGGGVLKYGTSRTICFGAADLRCALPDHLRKSNDIRVTSKPIKMLKTDLGKVAGRARESRVIICCKSEKVCR